jgi:glycosyltransferase involved in cell wall biosynthesis
MLSKIRIVQVGPLIRTFGSDSGQGGGLRLRLLDEGAELKSLSRFKNRYFRMVNIICGVSYYMPKSQILLLHSFGLRAAIMEDIVTRIAVMLKKSIIIRIHGGGFIEFFHKRPDLVSRLLKRAHIINTPSLYLQKELKNLGFKVEYLPNFVNLQKFQMYRLLKHRYSLLWVRAFHETYNPELAIEAFKIIQEKYPSATLTMVGHDQGLLDYCVKIISSYSLQDKVLITGHVPNDKLHEYYQTHEVFLTTTRYESFGVAIMESAACGIPCVCVPVGEIPYIWNDRVNILFARRDPEDFAAKISELFDNQDLANNISVNANKNAKQFTWSSVKPLWLDTFKRLS